MDTDTDTERPLTNQQIVETLEREGISVHHSYGAEANRPKSYLWLSDHFGQRYVDGLERKTNEAKHHFYYRHERLTGLTRSELLAWIRGAA
jgi:hypothetical protein